MVEGIVADYQDSMPKSQEEVRIIVEQQLNLQRGQERLLEKIREDRFEVFEMTKGLKKRLEKKLKVTEYTVQECGGNDFIQVKIGGLGGNGETLRFAYRQSTDKKQVHYSVDMFSNQLPPKNIFRFSTTWVCDIHGFEECMFISELELACSACSGKEHPYSLSVDCPPELLRWILGDSTPCDPVLCALVVNTMSLCNDSMDDRITEYMCGADDEDCDEDSESSDDGSYY
eukprot:CAMPEP_0203760528 /NCGR_PEP_ID=MMETSP0098-20131031/13802_1 /ASSEMBLY_ACC=CAM_ASM_000208 /TAXON_ID=96639 /ORGANISM=" , Strain NY0313808BC1" /LENGTH=228 /DNA_ID=CAMNT_0050654127 /DNA_START=92 /DNA_END=778 /DNA_ORIENTATION=+